ncbi:hypothetical protein [Brevundimonas sp. UBA2416]|uniref:hypothetical protein n=1 Tax=Brevundimonas sp. UBA2416 TaxID=1946124 RepID=UPI0025C0F6E2|nr:hypothetical protein [Brevundimonas sp. UBA2416]HRJ62879.1 hypothetical protein [Brevundimonas sp.]
MTAVHGHVQQRAEQDQEERQPAEEMNTVLPDEQIGQPCAEGCEGEEIQDASWSVRSHGAESFRERLDIAACLTPPAAKHYAAPGSRVRAV